MARRDQGGEAARRARVPLRAVLPGLGLRQALQVLRHVPHCATPQHCWKTSPRRGVPRPPHTPRRAPRARAAPVLRRRADPSPPPAEFLGGDPQAPLPLLRPALLLELLGGAQAAAPPVPLPGPLLRRMRGAPARNAPAPPRPAPEYAYFPNRPEALKRVSCIRTGVGLLTPEPPVTGACPPPPSLPY